MVEQGIPYRSYSAPAIPARNAPLAIWSLVLGIAAYACFGIFAAIPAVILGHMALSKIKQDPKNLAGKGLALAGLILGYINIALTLLMIPLMIAILLPALGAARNAAQSTICLSQLKQIGMAVSMYQNDNAGHLPYDFKMLQQTGIIFTGQGGRNLLVCPSAKDQTVPSYEFVIQPVAQEDGKSRPPKFADFPNPYTQVIIREIEPNHRGKRNVLYMDAHVTTEP